MKYTATLRKKENSNKNKTSIVYHDARLFVSVFL